jgi:antitoxin ParD1/3/4
MLEDNHRMTDLSFSLPTSLQSKLDQRIADGGYLDAAEYLRDLIRRDLAEADEDAAWVRARLAEGEASGYLEADPRDVLREIMAKLPDA